MPAKLKTEIVKRLRLYRPADLQLLTRPEAAEYIGVSVSSLAHRSKAGRDPTPRVIGRSCYYHLVDLHAWPDSRAGRTRGDGR